MCKFFTYIVCMLVLAMITALEVAQSKFYNNDKILERIAFRKTSLTCKKSKLGWIIQIVIVFIIIVLVGIRFLFD